MPYLPTTCNAARGMPNIGANLRLSLDGPTKIPQANSHRRSLKTNPTLRCKSLELSRGA
jgi:hypothetical protein